MNNLKKIMAVTLVAASLVSTVAFASTSTSTEASIKDSVGYHQRGSKLDLNEDTKAVVDEMVSDGSTREEINEYLVSQGYELPGKNAEARGPKLDLDEDTKAVVDEMKTDGSTREEIRDYIVSQGYEVPERNVEARGPKLDLDEDTKTVVDGMVSDGSTREEIKEYLVSQGYELPEMQQVRGNMGPQNGSRPAGQNRQK